MVTDHPRGLPLRRIPRARERQGRDECPTIGRTSPRSLDVVTFFPEIVRGGVLVEPSIRSVKSEKRRSGKQSRSRQEGDGSLDLDEEKRSRYLRAHRSEVENPPLLPLPYTCASGEPHGARPGTLQPRDCMDFRGITADRDRRVTDR